MTRDLKLDLETIQARLEGWFRGRIPDAQELSLSPLRMPGMGASNETFFFDLHRRDGQQRKLEKLVVRWSPMRFPLYPKYDMKEQFLLLQHLQRTAVRVPEVRWLEEDASLIGSPFYVMERIEGWIPEDNPSYHREGPLFEGSPRYREAIWWQGVETLAAIHTLDWEKLGLGFLGAPADGTDPIDRHIAYYEKMLGMAEEEPPAVLVEAMRWLRDNAIVPRRVSLCWGDARLGNLIFHGEKVVGVLDWEMSLLGDPDSDLLWFLLMDWALSEGHFVAPAERLDGLPGREQTVAHYERATGRKVQNVFYHDVFATWRFAVIMHRADAILKATGYHQAGVDVHSNLVERLQGLLDL
jgi:aminoglycoside phosphotransferase (APT) family kinase protein